MFRRVLVSATAFALASLSLAATAVELVTTQLPRGVVPHYYDIAVTPHAETLTFDGAVTVALDVLQPTRHITLHALDLEFSSVVLTAADGTELPAPQVSVDPADQTATFTFAEPVPAGAYRLAMTYSGRIGTQAAGLFAIDYETATGNKRALFTQYEDADARRFLPCWDEPAHKAVFDVLARNMPAGAALGSLERQDFYKHARHCFAVVQCSEDRPFGCFILRKGVIFT